MRKVFPMFHHFPTNTKIVSIFQLNKKMFQFIQQAHVKKLHFFTKIRKWFHFFSANCEKCFNIFKRMWTMTYFLLQMQKVLIFFLENAKNVPNFLTRCEKSFSFFDKMQKKIHFFRTNGMQKVFHIFLENSKMSHFSNQMLSSGSCL